MRSLIPKYILCFTFLVLTISGFAQAAKPLSCPRNFDGKEFASLKGKVGKIKSKIIAFDAEIIELQSGYNEMPYMKVSFDNKQTVWIASMVSGKTFSVGKKIRILGIADQVSKDDEIGMRYNKFGIQVRAFAILDTQTKLIQMSDAFENEVKIWKNGKVPEAIK